jgi:phage FluMu protein Com
VSAVASERPPASEPAARELRCDCGGLAARVVGGHLELKCRRCQRIGLLSLANVAAGGTVHIQWHGAARARRR